MTLDRKFTEEEISDIMEGGLYDENDELLFEVVHEEIVSYDTEKGSATIEFVILDCLTDKLYMARLGRSQWYLQSEYNAKEPWTEVVKVQARKFGYVEKQ